MANSTGTETSSQWAGHKWFWLTTPIKFLICLTRPESMPILFLLPLLGLALLDFEAGPALARLPERIADPITGLRMFGR